MPPLIRHLPRRTTHCCPSKVPHYAMKATMTPLFYEYVQQQHEVNYEVSWSQWLTSRLMPDEFKLKTPVEQAKSRM